MHPHCETWFLSLKPRRTACVRPRLTKELNTLFFLASVVAICHKEFDIGEEVELQLMRRERDSLLPVPAAAFSQEIISQTPRLSHPTAASSYAKLLVASKEEASYLFIVKKLIS